MTMIFLSYSRKDIDIMYQVKQKLIQAGVTVWTDENLTPGTPAWAREIERNLHGCTAVVVMMSPTAKESRWVLRECTKAQQKGKPIFPLLIKGNPEDHIPLELCDIQYIDLRKNLDGGLNQLVNVFVSRGWTQQTPYFEPVPPKVVTSAPLVRSKAVVNKKDREDADLYFEEGNDLFYAKRYKEAIAAYTKAIELDPENGEYYDCRSDCYTELGDDDSALDDLVRGLEYG